MKKKDYPVKILPYAALLSWFCTCSHTDYGAVPGRKTIVRLLETFSSKIITSRAKQIAHDQVFPGIVFSAAIVSIVLNIIEYNKWQEGRKEGSIKPYPIRWFGFVFSSLVALGCMLNILISWIG